MGSLKVGGEVQLGAGASGEFRVRFVKGKFRFHMHGSLCLGPGAKGLVEGEITPDLFMEPPYGLSINSMAWTISTGLLLRKRRLKPCGIFC